MRYSLLLLLLLLLLRRQLRQCFLGLLLRFRRSHAAKAFPPPHSRRHFFPRLSAHE
jgi:hypothetical protein